MKRIMVLMVLMVALPCFATLSTVTATLYVSNADGTFPTDMPDVTCSVTYMSSPNPTPIIYSPTPTYTNTTGAIVWTVPQNSYIKVGCKSCYGFTTPSNYAIGTSNVVLNDLVAGTPPDTISATYVPYTGANNNIDIGTYTLTTTGKVTTGEIQSGAAGVDGECTLYSEQGATDYAVSLHPNAAMTGNADFYLPAAKPTGESFLKMGTDGVVDFDTATYLQLAGGTLTGDLYLGPDGDAISRAIYFVYGQTQVPQTRSWGLKAATHATHGNAFTMDATFSDQAPSYITAYGKYIGSGIVIENHGVGANPSIQSDLTTGDEAFKFLYNTSGTRDYMGGYDSRGQVFHIDNAGIYYNSGGMPALFEESDPRLPAYGTTGNILQSSGSAWASVADPDGVTGNEVTNTTDATLTRSGAGTSGDPYKLALNLGNANTWTANQSAPYFISSSSYNADNPRPSGWPESATNALDDEFNGTGAPSNFAWHNISGTPAATQAGGYCKFTGATSGTYVKAVSDGDITFAAKFSAPAYASAIGLVVLDSNGTGYGAYLDYNSGSYYKIIPVTITTWTTVSSGTAVNYNTQPYLGIRYYNYGGTRKVSVGISMDGKGWSTFWYGITTGVPATAAYIGFYVSNGYAAGDFMGSGAAQYADWFRVQ